MRTFDICLEEPRVSIYSKKTHAEYLAMLDQAWELMQRWDAESLSQAEAILYEAKEDHDRPIRAEALFGELAMMNEEWEIAITFLERAAFCDPRAQALCGLALRIYDRGIERAGSHISDGFTRWAYQVDQVRGGAKDLEELLNRYRETIGINSLFAIVEFAWVECGLRLDVPDLPIRW